MACSTPRHASSGVREAALIARLRALATHKAARGLRDDAAVWMPPLGRELVLTVDTVVEGVHFPRGDWTGVMWKALAASLSDVAAMGGVSAGVLASVGGAWGQDVGLVAAQVRGESGASGDRSEGALLADFGAALSHFNVMLWGGDTVRSAAGSPGLSISITAIGTVDRGRALARSGAQPGDELWVSGTIGDAGLGLAIALGQAPPDRFLLRRYRRPEPRLALGPALLGVVSACMDVSDGLLIDAARLAEASEAGIAIDLAAVPLSPAARARTAGEAGLLDRATAGDDYELLFTAPAAAADRVLAAAAAAKTAVARVGRVTPGAGLQVLGEAGREMAVTRMGWEH